MRGRKPTRPHTVGPRAIQKFSATACCNQRVDVLNKRIEDHSREIRSKVLTSRSTRSFAMPNCHFESSSSSFLSYNCAATTHSNKKSIILHYHTHRNKQTIIPQRPSSCAREALPFLFPLIMLNIRTANQARRDWCSISSSTLSLDGGPVVLAALSLRCLTLPLPQSTNK